LESKKVIENENKTNANQLEAGVAQDFLAPTAASRPDACTTFICLRYYRPFIQIAGGEYHRKLEHRIYAGRS
jgi:hypothetical protein